MHILITYIKIIVMFVLANVFLLFSTSFVVVSIFYSLLLLVVFSLKLTRQYALWIKPLSIILIFLVILQFIMRDVISDYGDGLYIGFFSALRILSITSLVFLFIKTTPLVYIGTSLMVLPFHLGIILFIALSLIDKVSCDVREVQFAQMARGHKKTWNVILYYVPILMPLFSRTITRSQKLVLGMQARGFTMSK